MAIWRGAGGSGDATTDAANEASVASTKAAEAEASATAAASSATSAATSATSASSSASSASTDASAAAASALAAANSETAAAASELNAAASEAAAGISESNAATSETNAQTAQTAAETAQTAAEAAQALTEAAKDSTLAAFDSFDDRYLGAKASDPTTDNDGDPLQSGMLYFNTVSGVMNVYDGSAWVAAYVSAAGVLIAANNLSDLTSTTTARSNLGVGTSDNVTFNNVTATNDLLVGSTYQLNVDSSTSRVGINKQLTTSTLDIGSSSSNVIGVSKNGVSTVGKITVDTDEIGLYSGGVAASSLTFSTGNSGPLSSASEAARIDGSGNVGIGTTSPTEKLDVSGNIAVSGTVDGRDIATDGTTLDTIEPLANSAVQPGDNVSTLTNDAGYLTSFTETNDLTAAVTWANVPDANITQSSVTQHQAALSITESQISDLGTYVTKTSATGSAEIPSGTTAQRDGTPAAGYLRFNTTDSSFEGYDGSAWGAIGGGGGATGGGSDQVFYENGQSVTTDYTLTTNTNAMSTGPITINSGVSVTIPTGGRWVVL